MANNQINDNTFATINGFGMAIIMVALVLSCLFLFFSGAVFIAIPLAIALFISLSGFFVVNPNEAIVATFFGSYSGQFSESGFFWANPFYTKKKVSLRTVNINTPILKVNDIKGNPIEIAAIVVWQVADPARAIFAVQNYFDFVQLQAESGIRQVASQYAYDSSDASKSLRGNLEAIGTHLTESIQSHVDTAGIVILEVKISHLAYSAEIAGAMLKKQQAEAIVAARNTLVEGAVSIVENALKKLEQDEIVTFNPEQKAHLVINLMTVLVGDTPAQPTIPMDKVG